MTNDDWFADLARIDNSPIVISRYGFKKAVFQGKNVLVPLEREESERLSRAAGIEPLFNCVGDQNGGCHHEDCTKEYCKAVHIGGGAIRCICSDRP